MWYWEIVLVCKSKNERLTVRGEKYPSQYIAEWEMNNWIDMFLEKMYLYRIIKSEVLNGQTKDN